MTPARLRRLRWAVRATLALGVAASVTANILHAQDNPISQAIAAWPPLALLITVELVSRIPILRRGLGLVRVLATAAIAGIAAWVSYWHMVGVVARYGETGSVPYLLPLSVDGLIVVASVSLVELAGRRDTHPQPTSTTAGAATAVPEPEQPAARVATTGPAPTAPTMPVSPVPLPVRLTAAGAGAGAGQPMPAPATAAATPAPDGDPGTALGYGGDTGPRAEAIERDGAPDPDRPRLADIEVGLDREPPDDEDEDQTDDDQSDDQDEDQTDDDQDDETDDGASLDPDLVPLLPAARQARDELLREGRTVSRDALARRLRRNGHAIRNNRVSELLRELRRETHQVNGSRPTVPA